MKYSEKSKNIIFHNQTVQSDLYRYLREEDVLVLLNRLPLEEYEHLKTVTFKTCEGASAFGLVYFRRIKSIVICDQSQRLSITNKTGKRGCLEEFGALPNMKWPTLAVKRYLLYHTFLHELRHTQIEKSNKKDLKDKIPNEKMADEYADHWRGEFYKEQFDHEDPVHNIPSEAEIERLKKYWPEAMKHLQEGIRHKGRKEYVRAIDAYEMAIHNMTLYFGDLGPVNHDVEKLNDTIDSLKKKSVLIVLSRRSNDTIYKETCETLVDKYNAKIIGENDYGSYGHSTVFDIEGQILRILLGLAGVYLYPTMTDENPLTGKSKLIVSLKNHFKR